jgi:WD40 repeat protein
VLASPQFSADGHFAAYATSANFTNQIYLYDWDAKTNILLSTPFYSSGPGNGACYSANISSDGRFIAWYSIATNLVPGDANASSDVFLYDRSSGATTLLSVSRFGNLAADNRSLTPVFSPDGRTLAFQSWAADLVPFDLNRNGDIFALNLYPSNSIAPFTVQVFPPTAAGKGPTLSWAAVSGRTYAVQFKNALDDPSWQAAIGEVSIVGNLGYYTDIAPAEAQKFYRVVGY